jgi:hypothetical protein
LNLDLDFGLEFGFGILDLDLDFGLGFGFWT